MKSTHYLIVWSLNIPLWRLIDKFVVNNFLLQYGTVNLHLLQRLYTKESLSWSASSLISCCFQAGALLRPRALPTSPRLRPKMSWSESGNSGASYSPSLSYGDASASPLGPHWPDISKQQEVSRNSRGLKEALFCGNEKFLEWIPNRIYRRKNHESQCRCTSVLCCKAQ